MTLKEESRDGNAGRRGSRTWIITSGKTNVHVKKSEIVLADINSNCQRCGLCLKWWTLLSAVSFWLLWLLFSLLEFNLLLVILLPSASLKHHFHQISKIYLFDCFVDFLLLHPFKTFFWSGKLSESVETFPNPRWHFLHSFVFVCQKV